MNKDFSYYVSLIVIAVCVITLAVSGAVFCCGSYLSQPKVDKVDVKIINSEKKIKNVHYLSQAEIDSLINIIKKQESQLAEKYQYVVEQKSDDERYYSTIAVILGVVFSLFGLFGYKSVTNIEEKATKTAEDKAEKIAKVTSEKAFNDFLDEKAMVYVTNASRSIFESEGANILKDKVKADLYKYFETRVAYEVDYRLKELGILDKEQDNITDSQNENNENEEKTVEPQF